MTYKPQRLQTAQYKDTRLRPWYDTAKWRILRKMFLQDHPLCECDDCKRLRRLRTANVVHHIIPHQNLYEELFWDQSNWLAMNSKCHNHYTMAVERKAMEKRGRGV